VPVLTVVICCLACGAGQGRDMRASCAVDETSRPEREGRGGGPPSTGSDPWTRRGFEGQGAIDGGDAAGGSVATVSARVVAVAPFDGLRALRLSLAIAPTGMRALSVSAVRLEIGAGRASVRATRPLALDGPRVVVPGEPRSIDAWFAVPPGIDPKAIDRLVLAVDVDDVADPPTFVGSAVVRLGA
jgi:hypothetical protein